MKSLIKTCFLTAVLSGAIVFSACLSESGSNNGGKSTSPFVGQSRDSVIFKVEDSLRHTKPDTLILQGTVYYLFPISEAQFLRTPETPEIPSRKTPAHVSFQDSSGVTFHFRNGRDTSFSNNFEPGWGNYYRYMVKRDYLEIPYWCVHIALYEGSACFLLDKRDGKALWLYNEPIFSEDKKHFVTHAADLEAQYVTNGIQFCKIGKNGAAVQLWDREISDWEPRAIKWLDNSTILIKQTFIDWKKPNHYEDRYVRMKLLPSRNNYVIKK